MPTLLESIEYLSKDDFSTRVLVFNLTLASKLEDSILTLFVYKLDPPIDGEGV